MHIRTITLHHIRLKLISPFVTSYGAYTDRDTILIEMADEAGTIGWGECVAFASPWYTEETVDTAWLMMQQYFIPRLLGQQLQHPNLIPQLFAHVKRHPMAKAGLETAAWDLYSKRQGQPLWKVLGGTRQEIATGVAVGLQSSENELYRKIDAYLEEGYKRIKVKIKPGMDVELIRGIRERFPELPLMADANSAYGLQDIEHLQQLDEYSLMMLEQPLGADDIVDHAQLQQRMQTPICLDESLLTADDVRKALQLGSCRVVNVKIGRVGGLTEALRIHDLCAAHDVPVWCGGMLESGVGRAHGLALASLSNFRIPGDLSASSRYWEQDVVQPEITLYDGKIRMPQSPGIGFEVNQDFVAQVTVRRERFTID